ncbi:TetR/AcrR family transcriptional regulator [Amycolatopsis panacis]|uniref:TetR/AcrR family transcriptional regulator n=1 Tax=Amycolatopsis panacis TaxID=2340917 RepID=A0A419HM38_9PSEU|nr:TetR/AcrR family transcriptional regulator [Amycolatopsis panacis]RJQ77067.1 TetR/AcrR family transcriptional regulator [Amycolatopsis panacis]
MGNREALLAGAKQCLVERGWAHTTVRDIAEAAGVNHAAIGYHFGSRDMLLTRALGQALDELGAEIADRLAEEPAQRWPVLIGTFTTHRALWVALLEASVEAQRSPEVHKDFVAMLDHGRAGLGGPIPMALLLGLMMQCLADPGNAPAPADVIAGLGSLT